MSTSATVFSAGQSLQIFHNGDVYRFNILHATLDEVPKQQRGPLQHAHEVYHIVLFTHGESRCMVNNNWTSARRGALFLTSPNIPHSFNVADKNSCRYHELTFSFEHPDRGELLLTFHQVLEAYCGIKLPPLPAPFQVSEETTSTLERQFIRIMDILEVKSPLAHLDLSLAVGRLLYEIIRSCYLIHQPRPVGTMERLLEARQHIELNYADNDSIDELARRACLSRGYFLREFKKLVGESPNTYRIQLRINAARALLRTSNLQCREIALRTGFSDEYHFSRTFKQVTGQSPTAYRAQV